MEIKSYLRSNWRCSDRLLFFHFLIGVIVNRLSAFIIHTFPQKFRVTTVHSGDYFDTRASPMSVFCSQVSYYQSPLVLKPWGS